MLNSFSSLVSLSLLPHLFVSSSHPHPHRVNPFYPLSVFRLSTSFRPVGVGLWCFFTKRGQPGHTGCLSLFPLGSATKCCTARCSIYRPGLKQVSPQRSTARELARSYSPSVPFSPYSLSHRLNNKCREWATATASGPRCARLIGCTLLHCSLPARK